MAAVFQAHATSSVIAQAEQALKPYAGQSMTDKKIQEVMQILSKISPTEASPPEALPSVQDTAKNEQKFFKLIRLNLTQMQAALQENPQRPIYFPQNLVATLSRIAHSYIQTSPLKQKGSFGALAFLPLADQNYVVKSPTRGYDNVHINEIRHLQSLPDHPNVIAFCGIITQPDQRLYIVLEYMPDGDLGSLLRTSSLEKSEIDTILSQVMGGIQHLHAHGVIHCDMKPENVVVRKDPLEVKIIDFGISTYHPPETDAFLTIQFQGSPLSLSPEYALPSARNADNRRLYLMSPKMDIWGLGCLLFKMISPKPADYAFAIPYGFVVAVGRDFFSDAKSSKDSFKAVLQIFRIPDLNERINGVIHSIVNPVLTEEALKVYVSFMEACFKINPEERSSINALVRNFSDLLHHPQQPKK